MNSLKLSNLAGALLPLVLADKCHVGNVFRLPGGGKFQGGRSVVRQGGDYYWRPNKGGAEIRRKTPKIRMSKKERLMHRRARARVMSA